MARTRPKKKAPRRILVVDVGGSHVKFIVMGVEATGAGQPQSQSEGEKEDDIQRFPSGPKMSADSMARQLRKLVAKSEYDAVSIGYPGLIVHGKIAAEPYNLGRGWVGFDFQRAFGKPVRLINDAAMQAVGSYRGGRMLFLGLGTGLGVTLILDGVVEPMEIGHLPYKHGRSFEDYAGERGRERLGTKKWRKKVTDIVDQLKKSLEVDYVVLGGGNVTRLKELPQGARRGDNRNAFIGGVLIWQSEGDPLMLRTHGRVIARKSRAK